MNTKWRKKVELTDDGVIGTDENTATYSPWLHSMARQTPIHASREWRKVDKIALDTKDRVVEFFRIAAQQWASSMRGK
jgi:hypothetical protein